LYAADLFIDSAALLLGIIRALLLVDSVCDSSTFLLIDSLALRRKADGALGVLDSVALLPAAHTAHSVIDSVALLLVDSCALVLIHCRTGGGCCCSVSRGCR